MSDERPEAEDGTLRVAFRRRQGAIAEAVRRLDDAGVGVEDVAVRRPTLDDVFISLTGHAAEVAEEEEARVTRPSRTPWSSPGATCSGSRARPTCCCRSRCSR